MYVYLLSLNVSIWELQKSHSDGGVGRQELCPNSGVFIQITKLKAIHHKAGYKKEDRVTIDCKEMKLIVLLLLKLKMLTSLYFC